MRTIPKARSYDEVLTLLRRDQFDVREVPGVADQIFVSKYGAGAILMRNPVPLTSKSSEAAEPWLPVLWVTHPGPIVGGKVATILDRGFQKFFTTPDLTVAATADGLKSTHRFAEELRAIIGEPSLYNESLGSVSDSYLYDRVKGRDLPPSERATPPWEMPGRR